MERRTGPESAEAASRAAHARAEAVLKAQRRAQLALRQQASLAAVEGDGDREAERCKAEAAASAAEVAQLRAEVSAMQGELKSEAAAERERREEAENLGQRLRQAEAEEAVSSSELARLKASEVAVVQDLQSEMEVSKQERASAVRDIAEVRRCLEEAQLDAAQSASAAQAACDLDKEEVAALRSKLDAALAQAASARSGLSEEQELAKERERRLEAEVHRTAASFALQRESAAALLALREQAARSIVATLLARQTEGLVAGVFLAWSAAREPSGRDTNRPNSLAQEAMRAAVLPFHDNIIAERAAVPTCSGSTVEERAAVLPCRDNITGILSGQREQAARRAFASSLADKLECIVRGAFCSWRDALQCGQAPPHGESPLAGAAALLLRQRSAALSMLTGLISTCIDFLVRGTFVAWRDLIAVPEDAPKAVAEPSDARELADCRSEMAALLAAKVEAEERSQRLAAQLESLQKKQEMLERESVESNALAKQQHIDASWTATLQGRRIEAAVGVLSGLLAGSLEQCLHSTFFAWYSQVRAATALAVVEAESKKQQAELRQDLERALEGAAEAQGTAKQAMAEAAAELRSELASESSAKEAALEAASRSQQHDARQLASMTAEVARLQAEVARLQGAAAEAEAVCSSSSRSSVCREAAALRREESSRRVLGSVIAAQWEAVAIGALHAWRLATVSSRAQQQQLDKEACLEASTGSAWLRRRGAFGQVLATLIAGQLEALMYGVLHHWREAVAAATSAALAEEASCSAKRETAALRDELQRRSEEEEALRQQLQRKSDSEAAASLACQRAEAKFQEAALEAARLQECLESARQGDQNPLPEQALQDQTLIALLVRREHISQGVICGLLAKQSEACVRSIFCSWCDVHYQKRRRRCEKVLAAWRGLCEARHGVILQATFHEWSQMASAARGGEKARPAGQHCVRATPEVQSLDRREATKSACELAGWQMATRSVVSTILARELEACAQGAFSSWASVVRSRSSASPQAAGVSPPAEAKEVQSTRHVAEEALLRRSEQATRRVLAAVLAAQAEAVVAGVFKEWRESMR